jgi:hypothetical protein
MHVKDAVGHVRPAAWLESFLRDVRLALRMLRRNPGFTARLWRIGDTVGCCYATGFGQDNWRFSSWEAFKHFRAETPAFEELTGFQVGSALLR